ncbi:DUF4124 domain-containing protein [Cupriavidus sp. NPDC089707]|uniref:DUF4124 domain-containing protein n=1 Tax=Cupriavidus sp. NPDC089707 TaxID=3363963 RepID=UPI003822D386
MDASSRKASRAASLHQFRVRFPVLVGAVALTLGSWAGLSQAQSSSDVYVCTGPNGVPEYRNGNAGKGCKKLNLPDVVTVPGGRIAPAPAKGGAAAASNASFPRVDSATQRSRDGERRTVLTQELQAEEVKLQALRAEYNNGQPERQGNERNYQKYLDRTAALRDDIARSEANAASLRRELGNLKD